MNIKNLNWNRNSKLLRRKHSYREAYPHFFTEKSDMKYLDYLQLRTDTDAYGDWWRHCADVGCSSSQRSVYQLDQHCQSRCLGRRRRNKSCGAARASGNHTYPIFRWRSRLLGYSQFRRKLQRCRWTGRNSRSCRGNRGWRWCRWGRCIDLQKGGKMVSCSVMASHILWPGHASSQSLKGTILASKKGVGQVNGVVDMQLVLARHVSKYRDWSHNHRFFWSTKAPRQVGPDRTVSCYTMANICFWVETFRKTGKINLRLSECISTAPFVTPPPCLMYSTAQFGSKLKFI